MIRKYVDGDIDAVMQIWLNTNIQAHSFISPDYWQSNFDTVKGMMPLAEVYVYEDDCTKQIGGFIGMNDNYIEGIFGKQLLNYAKEGKSTLRLSVYQKNKKAIRFYLREEFAIQSENIDNNTDEKEFVMVWNR